MSLERLGRDPARPLRKPDTQSSCLGCPDCRGNCLSLSELALLPDLILHKRQVQRA